MNPRTLPSASELRHHREARLVGLLLVAGSLVGLLGIVVRSALETARPHLVDTTADPSGRR